MDLHTPLPDTGLAPQPIAAHVAAQLELPLLVVDGGLSTVWANAAARRELAPVWAALDAAGCRSAAGLHLRSQLQDLVLAGLRAPGGAEALLECGDNSWFGTAAPLRGRPGLALLRLGALRQRAPPVVAARLQRLFGLSRAEALVAVQLADGHSLDCIAAERGVSVDTVRAQVRNVFHKTGLHRQGALICAVGRLAGG